MQNVSQDYKKMMQLPIRNRGYISARIGIISSTAQENIEALESKNEFAYFSNDTEVFKEEQLVQIYATGEENFSKVDGSMFFLPEQSAVNQFYNDGLVSKGLFGSICVSFDGNIADIKGLTIDFGEYYPTSFKVIYDYGEREYTNANRVFVTEDTYDAVTYIIVKPLEMINGSSRLRIFQFSCGISNTFSNKQVKSFTYKEFVSTVCEALPSQDITLTVDNQNLYYNPDNPESASAYLEQGQKMKVAFGYDVFGDGNIEWVPEFTTYLKSWSATDTEAKFTMVDVLDWKMQGTYYKGLYRQSGIPLYDLAIDVLNDAGLTEDEYFIDPYLKNVRVINPIPAVKHSEALQIISNAGRCVLNIDRKGKINIRSSFVPDTTVMVPDGMIYPLAELYPSIELYPMVEGQTAFSNASNIMLNKKKTAYAMASNDFSIVDGSIKFLPYSGEYLNDVGYVSGSVADENGNFITSPIITIRLEAGYTCYGLGITFRNIAPKEFKIRTYYQDSAVEEFTYINPDINFIMTDQLNLFDKMEIEFTKGYPNARITVDTLQFGNATDYTLSRNFNLTGSPVATRMSRVRGISVKRSVYRTGSEQKELTSEEIELAQGETTRTIYFSNPSYNFSVYLEGTSVQAEVLQSSNYYAELKFTNNTGEIQKVQYSVKGYEYAVEEQYYRKTHNDTGEEITWGNPLVSDMEHAKDMEEWLASYYLGDVDYQVSWNGDPRVDANDLFYLDLKDREETLIRAYQNELKFSGAWSGVIKARKAVL